MAQACARRGCFVPPSVLIARRASVDVGPGLHHVAAWRVATRRETRGATLRGIRQACSTTASIAVDASETPTPKSAASGEAQAIRSTAPKDGNDGVLPLPKILTGPAAEMAPRYEFRDVENEIYKWWEASGMFKPCEENGKPPFVIYMPPPNVTGGLHIGHALGTTLQDILTRYNRMTGRPTLFLPGTDHAGIATQLQVEKAIAKDGMTRFDLGRDAFVDKVWEWKAEKGGYICQQMRSLGASCDWARHRFTLEEDISAAVREAFVRLYDRGLLYRGDYMVNWSPNLMTAVSDLEVDFTEEKGKLYFFKYPLSESTAHAGEHIPVATTRPETIIGDTAVCVHPEDERYKKFIGSTVTVPIIGREIPVIADEYVDREFGTGALKITPGHDANDYELGKKHDLPIINIMNRDASINEEGGELFQNLDRFEARAKLWEKMEAQGLVLKVEEHTNRVPRSQRGGEVIEPLVSTQWFVKMESLAKPALEAVRSGEIRIVPERFEKVYNNWLSDIHDWCVSRQLWWGHRIPVWYVQEHPGDYIVARDDDEARNKALEKYPGEEVTLRQENDVLDTWFSSGLWPFATMGWPNENAADFKQFYPGSVMETGYDIIFFWVSRMIMMGMDLTDKPPFHTVYLHGLVRDGQGRKMSKTTGNVIDPLDTIAEFGTDAVRYSLVTGTTPGQDVPLSLEKVEANRNFANKLWNACRYVLGNLSEIGEDERRRLATVVLDGYGNEDNVSGLPLPERYIVSRLHIVTEAVTRGLETMDFGDVGRRIYEFLWDEFADWYVEASKTRLYGEDEAAAAEARATLVYVLDTCLRLLHPFMPYVTEALWHRFPRDGSPEYALIASAWPSPGYVDHASIRRFERIQALIRSVRNARAEYQLIPSRKIPLSVRADPVSAKDVSEERAVLGLLAKLDLDRLEVNEIRDPATEGDSASSSSNGDSPASDSSTLHLIVADRLEAFLPMKGMLDVEKEKGRLEKQMSKVQKDLDGLQKRLSAPGFAKAPEKVRAETKASAGELSEQIANLTRRMAEVEALRGPEQ